VAQGRSPSAPVRAELRARAGVVCPRGHFSTHHLEDAGQPMGGGCIPEVCRRLTTLYTVLQVYPSAQARSDRGRVSGASARVSPDVPCPPGPAPRLQQIVAATKSLATRSVGQRRRCRFTPAARMYALDAGGRRPGPGRVASGRVSVRRRASRPVRGLPPLRHSYRALVSSGGVPLLLWVGVVGRPGFTADGT
jgi:hypothetical protein